MILSIIYLLLSLGANAAFFYFLHLYENWWWFWVPIIGVPLLWLLIFGISLAILFIISKTFNMKVEPNKPDKVAHWITMQVNHQINFLLGVRVRKTGMHGVSKKGPYMIIYNHMSNFDPMIIMDKFRRVICVTKPENKHAPIAGPFIHKSGFISINRENDAEGIKAINKAIEYIEKYKWQICIAPEGTRSKSGVLLPFHPGTFNIAKRTGVPILCIGLKNTNAIHKNVLKRFTKVNMDVLAIVEPSEYMELSTVEITSKIHKLYEDYLGQ